MKHLKFLVVVAWLGLLATSCQKDDIEDAVLSNSEIIQKPISAKVAAVNTDNRNVIAQFFSGPDFDGQVHTVSIPANQDYVEELFNLPFEARSWAIVKGVSLSKRFTPVAMFQDYRYDEIFSEKNHHGYYSESISGHGTIQRLKSDFTTWILRANGKYKNQYAGQLISTNGKSSIPIWGNTDLRGATLDSRFNNKVKQFTPASRSPWNHAIFRKNDINSDPIALHPIKHHRGGRNFAGHHGHIRKNISYLQVTSRQQFSHAGWDEYGLIVGNRVNKLLKQLNKNVDLALSKIGCWIAKGIQSQGDPSGTHLHDQAITCGVDSPVDHKPTSGVELHIKDPYDTYLIGGYNKDLKFIIDQLKYPKIKKKDVINGENNPPPGQNYNILNDDDAEYNQIFNTYGAGAFFRMVNAKWIDNAVRKKRCIKAVTHPSKCLRNKNGLTGFGKEVHRLEHKHGYRWDEKKKKFVPGNQAPNQKTWTNRGEAKVHI